MGLFDKIKGKVSGEQIDKGVDMVDQKTGGKLGDKSDMIKDKAKDVLGAEEENQNENAQDQGSQDQGGQDEQGQRRNDG